MPSDACLRVECLLPEKLVDRATRDGARFSSVRRADGRTLIVECDATSAKIMKALCARFGIPCRVARRARIDALRHFARCRATLAAGLALAAALCALFLGRFWIVDVAFSGPAAHLGDRAALLGALRAAGVRPGVSRRVDTALLARTLESGPDGYSYVCAHRQGVRLLVEAVPESPAPEVYDVDAARDLVADCDGIVLRAVARSGELCVRPGDAVRRGQPLIRGEEKASADGTRPIAALGEVVVRAWCAGEARLPLSRTQTTLTGRAATDVALTAPWGERPIERGEDFASWDEQSHVTPIGGLFVPIHLRSTLRRETASVEARVDPEALKGRAAALALSDAGLALAREYPAGCEIARRWVEYETRDGALIARAVYEIHTDAAVSRGALQGG